MLDMVHFSSRSLDMLQHIPVIYLFQAVSQSAFPDIGSTYYLSLRGSSSKLS